MDAAERLTAAEEIKQLKARYFRCMDTKDWAGFEEVFAPDAVMDMSGEMRDPSAKGAGIANGATKIAAFVRKVVDPVVTVHHGHMPEIEITSPTTAKGIWAMEDKLRWPEGAAIKTMHGYGHYHETYERTDVGWRIKTITLTRLRVDTEMA
jgi:SnoaL-like protein